MTNPREPAQAALWGTDHPELGSVAVEVVDGAAAVALSPGLHPKPYPHVDPNEDAVLAAVSRRCRLLAVADGHNGFDAAAGALRALRDRLVGLDTVADDPAGGLAAFEEAAVLGVREALNSVEPARRHSRTALSLLLAVPGAVHVCQWGDTVALRLRGSKARLLAPPAPFLSARGEVPRRTTAGLRPDDRVVAASDGLTTYLGNGWARRVAEIVADGADLEAAARNLVEAAFAGGAGDHVAVALVAPGRP